MCLVTLNDQRISEAEDAKYLGIANLDRKLNWKKHIYAKRKRNTTDYTEENVLTTRQ